MRERERIMAITSIQREGSNSWSDLITELNSVLIASSVGRMKTELMCGPLRSVRERAARGTGRAAVRDWADWRPSREREEEIDRSRTRGSGPRGRKKADPESWFTG